MHKQPSLMPTGKKILHFYWGIFFSREAPRTGRTTGLCSSSAPQNQNIRPGQGQWKITGGVTHTGDTGTKQKVK